METQELHAKYKGLLEGRCSQMPGVKDEQVEDPVVPISSGKAYHVRSGGMNPNGTEFFTFDEDSD